MAELRHNTTKRTRRRRVGSVRSVKQTEELLNTTMDDSLRLMEKIEALQESLVAKQTEASTYMEELNISKHTSNRTEAVYEHPPQKSTDTYNAEGLFADIAVEDFLASVKVQKGMASKVVDPKVLKKHTTTTLSKLKPKTIKLKPRK